MSRYDYRDPGTDSAYCDALSDPPSPPHKQDDAECDCHECIDDRKAADELSQPPRQELCPNCNGNGVTWNHVEGGFLEKVQCGDCHGKGYTEEEL